MALIGLYDVFAKNWEGQTVWVTSDTHFGDADLKAGFPNRPSDEDLVKLMNTQCGKRDVLIHLGDVGNVEYVRQLRAQYKVLVMGNHDAGATNYKRVVEKRIFDRDIHPDKAEVRAIMEAEYPGWRISVYEEHDLTCPFDRWVAIADNGLFDEVYEGPLMVAEKLLFSHERVDVPWAFNAHGHDHKGVKHANCMNVCLDANGYKMINLNQFLKQGHTAKVQTIHRATIDGAIERKKKRGGKKIGQR